MWRDSGSFGPSLGVVYFKKTNEWEMTISLIKVCSVQWKMPLKLLACFAVSTPDGVNASGIPSAARKL